jgi:hypothetical protein
VVAREEIGLEVNAEKTKYMVMSRDQNAGRNYSMKNDSKSFEREEQLKYFGTTLMDQIPFILKPGNVCYHLLQHLLSSSLLSKNIKTKTCRTIISPVILCGCETWSLTLIEECRLRVFENRC